MKEEKKTYGLSIPVALDNELRELARSQRRSKSSLITLVLEQFMEDQKKSPRPAA